MLVLDIINNFLKGHQRTVKAKKNILASLIIKGCSIITGFLMIRIVLDYLDQTKYGIWLTLTSFITWFAFFEIGLGRGLQNKLSIALTLNDYKSAKTYVSTTYAILTTIVFFIVIIFFIGNRYIDWSVLLNADRELSEELSNLALIVFGFFFIRFVLQLINIIITADQRPAIANAFNPIGNMISLALIYFLTRYSEKGSLYNLGLVLSIVPTVVLIVASIYFFNGKYSSIKPHYTLLDSISQRICWILDLNFSSFKFLV